MGGIAGHMMHPYDCNELKRDDILDMIRGIFNKRIDLTEKLDGFNIVATKNLNGEIVFIRNKKDLNSKKGGMTLKDMKARWEDKPNVLKIYSEAAAYIKEVLDKLPIEYFNPDEATRVAFNIECITKGVTNLIPYTFSRVFFHGTITYEFSRYTWAWEEANRLKIQEADPIRTIVRDMDHAAITNPVYIYSGLCENYAEGLSYRLAQIMPSNITLSAYKLIRFCEYLTKNGDDWVFENPIGMHEIFKRIFDRPDKINLNKLKKMYPDYLCELDTLLSRSKSVVEQIMEELDLFFIEFGNKVIMSCLGATTSTNQVTVCDHLNNELNKALKEISANGTNVQINRARKNYSRMVLPGKGIWLNHFEGVCFEYKGHTFKLTGSFGPLNQIVGDYKYNRSLK